MTYAETSAKILPRRYCLTETKCLCLHERLIFSQQGSNSSDEDREASSAAAKQLDENLNQEAMLVKTVDLI